MRYFSVGLLVAAAVSPLMACSDDGGGGTTDPSLPTPTLPGMTDAMTSTTQPTDGTANPTTEDPSVGSDSIGTDSNSTSGTSTTPVTSDTSTSTGPDPDTGNTTVESTTTEDTTTDSSSSGTTMVEPPPCVEADCVNMGEYCSPDTGTCLPGCNEDLDCGAPTVCDTSTNMCVGCLADANCGPGTICDEAAGVCVPGCTDMQACGPGLACCDGQCFDLQTDVDHCGSCSACPPFDNADAECIDGTCSLGACDLGFENCDGSLVNGCEFDGACECTPNMQTACYTGPDGTENVGICHGGTQTCNAQGTGYGPCVGEVTPAADDMCGNNLDDNCNNVVDDNPDADGDGYNKCTGNDCCDSVSPFCLSPALVNPGAFDVMGNMLDDDCNGSIDGQIPACDAGLASNSGNVNDYPRAMDLCQFTTANPPQAQKVWGVVSADTAFLRTNDAAYGSNFVDNRSIRPGFGTNIVRQKNSNMVVLSSGNAADVNDTNPGYVAFQGSQFNAPDGNPPAAWVAAHGGTFHNAPNCPAPFDNTTYDGLNLKLRIRVPTNAQSFSVKMHFMSSEWPEWVCTAYNDLFVTLITSGNNTNPSDKNIAIYKMGNNTWPVGVNIAKAAPGLFTECRNGNIGCAGGVANTVNYVNCTAGEAPLAGTGMQDLNQAGCGTNDTTGGGTGWLTMSGNVTPGEIMEIRFMIWDTGDEALDSLVFLDAWEWSVMASQPGVEPG